MSSPSESLTTNMRSETLVVAIVIPSVALIIVLSLLLLYASIPMPPPRETNPRSHKRRSIMYPNTHDAPAAAKSARARNRLSVLDHKLKTKRYCDWAKELPTPEDSDTETPLWFVPCVLFVGSETVLMLMLKSTICLEPFTPEAKIRGLACAHAFHSECLDEWYARCNEWCPLCHRAIVPGSILGKEVKERANMGVFVSGGFLV
jgi:hypothetical protein